MIASVLHISRADYEKIRENNKDVFDTYTLHKIVYSLFPRETTEKTRSFLFAYKGGDFYEKRILLLSKNKPAEPEYGTIESKEIPSDFLLQNLYGFEVQVNPVRRDSKNGKIIPVRGKDELLKWFSDKAPSFGFEVVPDSLSVSDTDVLKFNKEGHAVVLGKAVFVGKLKVTERQLFISTFENGLGREKAFGFGLFQIVPLTNASVGA